MLRLNPTRSGGELFFGLVGAAGTDLTPVSQSLQHNLNQLGYSSEEIRLSSLLPTINNLKVTIKESPEEDRISTLMDAGNAFRKITEDESALAVLAISVIRDSRKNKNNDSKIPRKNHAYIFKSLKHQKEVEKLREIYGKNFWLVAAYSPRETRVSNLAKIISESHHDNNIDKYRSDAEKLINRDEYEVGEKFGQTVRDTFPLADVFIDNNQVGEREEAIKRFIELIFGNTFHTPKKEEYGMFHAFANAIRSSSLSRQVGSSITTPDGDVIATGTNEVPKAGGGLYTSDDTYDYREFKIGYDSNDRKKESALADIFSRLKQEGWITDKLQHISPNDLVKKAKDSGILNEIQIMNLTEFGREVHAEMAALMDAVRRTIEVRGCTLYCTTFPCHICAKHIIASGIMKVVFIEPYPKSLAKELFSDSITVDQQPTPDKVNFKPFVGIAPRKYMALFTMLQRKRNGDMIQWIGTNAYPRYSDVYLEKEANSSSDLLDRMSQKKLKIT